MIFKNIRFQMFRFNYILIPRRFSSSQCTKLRERIIRVDHAGELGADRIYAGQMAVLGNTTMGKQIAHMWEQEKEHRRKFEVLINKHRVRPTAMVPIWNVAGFMLGAGTALLGEKAAMACTVAVEDVIVKHYNSQLTEIMECENPDKVINEKKKSYIFNK